MTARYLVQVRQRGKRWKTCYRFDRWAYAYERADRDAAERYVYGHQRHPNHVWDAVRVRYRGVTVYDPRAKKA
jgi:hypothetical protein